MQVSAGVDHTCGVRPDGLVECWGLDDVGQADPPAGTFSQVGAGNWFTCGVTANGGVMCWGADDFGQSQPP